MKYDIKNITALKLFPDRQTEMRKLALWVENKACGYIIYIEKNAFMQGSQTLISFV